ncbi:hypothetical protein OROMI_002343 [Orobanche minor]
MGQGKEVVIIEKTKKVSVKGQGNKSVIIYDEQVRGNSKDKVIVGF